MTYDKRRFDLVVCCDIVIFVLLDYDLDRADFQATSPECQKCRSGKLNLATLLLLPN